MMKCGIKMHFCGKKLAMFLIFTCISLGEKSTISSSKIPTPQPSIAQIANGRLGGGDLTVIR